MVLLIPKIAFAFALHLKVKYFSMITPRSRYWEHCKIEIKEPFSHGDVMQTATVQKSTSAKIRFCMLLARAGFLRRRGRHNSRLGRQDGMVGCRAA